MYFQVNGFWELGVAPGEYRQEKQKNAKINGFWELGVAPGEYRQEKQKNAKLAGDLDLKVGLILRSSSLWFSNPSGRLLLPAKS
ncbi:hypothetical protein NDU88_007254 [Pleurodeles waltl]|uniref:Uncharacterized protein n=1 Tax=Pleurodeles waltl TaxID=8319 RepID=A0AAV7P0C1_PLEWA|nr:hypothetical protein NDU88_007254 [Pleurodeles waltl]